MTPRSVESDLSLAATLTEKKSLSEQFLPLRVASKKKRGEQHFHAKVTPLLGDVSIPLKSWPPFSRNEFSIKYPRNVSCLSHY